MPGGLSHRPRPGHQTVALGPGCSEEATHSLMPQESCGSRALAAAVLGLPLRLPAKRSTGPLVVPTLHRGTDLTQHPSLEPSCLCLHDRSTSNTDKHAPGTGAWAVPCPHPPSIGSAGGPGVTAASQDLTGHLNQHDSKALLLAVPGKQEPTVIGVCGGGFGSSWGFVWAAWSA